MNQWPEPLNYTFNKDRHKLDLKKIKKIEVFFKKKYFSKYKYAVLYPSGRASINAILNFFKFDRSKVVNIPKWMAYCLYQSIGTITNISINFKKADCFLIVHKWGFTTKYKKKNKLIIEDSADSIPNDDFLNYNIKSDFEIISLPKIIGSYSGGIVLSNNFNFFTHAKKIQSQNLRLGKIQSQKKYDFYFNKENNDWTHHESSNTSFDNNVLTNIENCLKNFEINRKIIKERQSILKEKFKKLQFDKYRLGPCAIFKKKDYKRFHKILELKHFNFKKFFLNEKYEKCFIFPIHFGISNKIFFQILKRLIKLK